MNYGKNLMQITKVNKLMFMKVLELSPPKILFIYKLLGKRTSQKHQGVEKNIQNDGPTDEQSLDENNGNFSCI